VEAPVGDALPKTAETAEHTGPDLITIFAPVVGLFHLATHGFPKRRPHPGDQVQAGQSLGVIELMHIPSDLISPVSGTIEGILAEDGAGVEYGQPLMVIQPCEEVSEDEAGMLSPPR
jgi:acetyl-CoA carboxylase biotin carboxyl carrier protein